MPKVGGRRPGKNGNRPLELFNRPGDSYPRQIRRCRQHQRHRDRRVRVYNGVVRRGRAGGRVDDLEADFLARLRAVEAVCAVDFGHVLGLCEGDVCALSLRVS